MKRFIFALMLISAFLLVLYETNKILNVPTYKIKFNTNGGSAVDSILIKENKEISKLPVTSKENYEFVGWYLNGEAFDLSLNINQDYTLDAVWKEKEAKTFTINFETLGGNNIESIELKENEELIDLPIPIKEGYEFETWMYQNKAINKIIGTKNMTLVAKYKIVN